MALNVYDDLLKDPRYWELVSKLGDADKAMGMIVNFWSAAQVHWKKDYSLLPAKQFPERWQPLVAHGFAEIHSEGIYANGAKEHWDWLVEVAGSRSKGGKRSAEVRKQKYGSADPRAEIVNKTGSGCELPGSDVKSLSLALSFNKKNKTKGADLENPPPHTENGIAPVVVPLTAKAKKKADDGKAVSLLIATYVEAFKARYHDTRPDISPKVRGRMAELLRETPLEEAQDMVQVFLQMDKDWFVTKHHDFESFMQNLNAVRVAMKTGKDPDRKPSLGDALREEYGHDA